MSSNPITDASKSSLCRAINKVSQEHRETRQYLSPELIPVDWAPHYSVPRLRELIADEWPFKWPPFLVLLGDYITHVMKDGESEHLAHNVRRARGVYVAATMTGTSATELFMRLHRELYGHYPFGLRDDWSVWSPPYRTTWEGLHSFDPIESDYIVRAGLILLTRTGVRISKVGKEKGCIREYVRKLRESGFTEEQVAIHIMNEFHLPRK